MSWLNGKTILVTGCCGTVGSELVNVLVSGKFGRPESIRGVDNNETALFYQKEQYKYNSEMEFVLADIRDLARIKEVMSGVDIVFHSAALKHVEMCERSPFDAVQTNIYGVRNIIESARSVNVEKVIFTSSDKAVNPTNVMGTSKLMGERLISAANIQVSNSKTVFASTRFGNVLGSNGSVLPIFARQIAQGGPVTLTDKRMTRFVMSCREAAELVIDSGRLAMGGEVFITKMPVLKIADLAHSMIGVLSNKNIETKEIGVKPGEKLYEELMTSEESSRAYELDRYFVILPAFRDIYRQVKYDYLGSELVPVSRSYVSESEVPMSVDEIIDYLQKQNLIDGYLRT